MPTIGICCGLVTVGEQQASSPCSAQTGLSWGDLLVHLSTSGEPDRQLAFLFAIVAFFWILRLLWLKHKDITTLMTVLFVVYPGFLSQPTANTKQNHLYGFGTALFSISLMLEAHRISSRLWKVVCVGLSILVTANYLLIYEYMLGLEAVRLVLLGFVLFRNGFNGLWSLLLEIARWAWPYLVTTLIFLYWRRKYSAYHGKK